MNLKKYFIFNSLVFMTACASITQGTDQVISFNLTPKEATCDIRRSSGELLGSVSSSSNLLQVSKGYGDLIVSCSADGYENKTFEVSSSTQTAGVLGILIDFGIVDMLTGAMWKYPQNISVTLDKSESSDVDNKSTDIIKSSDVDNIGMPLRIYPGDQGKILRGASEKSILEQ